MRNFILWVIIVAAMATSCCLHAAEEQGPPGELARIQKWQAKRDEWLKEDEGKAYVFWLCALSGKERARALQSAEDKYLLIAEDNPMEQAEAKGYRYITCKREKTSSLGYIWSNQSIAGYTWSNRPMRRSGYTWSRFSGFTWSDQRFAGFTWSTIEGARRYA